jgi:subtilisin family serine protease
MAMKSPFRLAVVAVVLACAQASGAGAAVLTPELVAQLAQHAAADRLPVIIHLADRVDLAAFHMPDRRKRDNTLLLALRAKAKASWPLIAGLLSQKGGLQQQQLWIINGVALTLPAWAIRELANNPLIGRIQYDAAVPFASAPASVASPSGSWNLDLVHVPDLWSAGVTGAGVVVASMDTGVDLAHPDLAASWRGGSNSWFDPYNQHATPFDFIGHGTQTMGLMVGGSSSGAPIGMAPGARWIAAKIFNDAGQSTLSKLHLTFQWLLDPDGNPATLDAPDVVNASWGLDGIAPGSCNLEFGTDIKALKTAGIAVVFAAGNGGPDAGTGASPAVDPGSYAVGSVDANLTIDRASSVGPSSCDGSIFPKLVAPGVNVVSSDLSFGGLPLYASVSGTSFAAPHVAGAMALLASAFPAATPTSIESALSDSARDLGVAGPDNQYGYGLLDVAAARARLAAATGQSGPLITSVAPTGATEGLAYAYQMVATSSGGGPLVYSLQSAPSGMSIAASTGMISWVPAHAQIGANAVLASVADASARATLQSFAVTVVKANAPPLAAADNYTTAVSARLTIAAPGVLANDTDADGDPLSAVLASNVAHGALTLDPNGGFTYVPATSYTGTDSFSYRATDGKANSAPATVTLTVQAALVKPPLAAADSFTAPVYRAAPYSTRTLAVLANDSAAGSAIDPASVEIVSRPAKGGTAKVNPSGTVSYVPGLRFSGTETFTYRVRNTQKQWSNTATVSVKVE